MKKGHLRRWLVGRMFEPLKGRLGLTASPPTALRRMRHTPQSRLSSPPSIWPFLIGLQML
jgi:hypothetical protein